jgi:hypothetical protein
VRPALDDQHAAARLGEAMSEDAARRAGADDHGVVALARHRGQRAQRGCDRVARLREPPARPALLVRLVLDRVPGRRVAVVAQVGHLGRGADHGLEHRPQGPEHPTPADRLDEAPLEKRLAGLRREHRQRRAQREQRPQRDRDQRELHAALGFGSKRGEVAVDVERDALGRDRLAVALDQHLGQRGERQEADRMQVAEAVGGAHRGSPPGHEQRGERDVDGHPAQEHRGTGDLADHGHVHWCDAAPEDRDDLPEDQRRVARGDDERRPAAAADVGGADRRERDEQHVLGEGVRDGAEPVGVADHQVADRQQPAPHRVDREQASQPPLLTGQRFPHGPTVSADRRPCRASA